MAKNKLFKILIILAAVIILSATSFWKLLHINEIDSKATKSPALLKTTRKDTLPIEPKPQAKETKAPEPEISTERTDKTETLEHEIETSNWKTFINTEYKYKVKYPDNHFRLTKYRGKEFAVALDSKNSVVGQDGLMKSGLQINIQANKTQKPLKECYSQAGVTNETIKKVQSMLRGYPAIEYKYISNLCDVHEGAYIKKDGFVYMIDCRYAKDSIGDSNICYQIIESFRFF